MAVVVAAVLAPLAQAQLLRPLDPVLGAAPPVGQTVGRTVGQATGALDETAGQLGERFDPPALLQARVRRLADFVRHNARFVEADAAGDPVVRGEVLAIAPSAQTLAAAQGAGFAVTRQTRLGALQIEVEVLAPPAGLAAQTALERLRQIAPDGQFELNHLYFGAGVAGGDAGGGATPAGGSGAQASVRIGLIDTGVQVATPALHGAPLEQRGFAPGAPAPAAHGTATASLIAGRLGRFRGAAPGARLYVADIYGRSPVGGSAEALAQALDWMAEVRAPVINVSLVGPPNALVAVAIRTLTARGARVVAAVGNDGPAAPPAYPASYPQAIAVTPVDPHDHVLPEAGRALHIDFAAPGDGFSAASLAGGLTPVRGASFASPIVAGRLAAHLASPNRTEAEAAVQALAREAHPIGPAGGHGVVGEDVRLADRTR